MPIIQCPIQDCTYATEDVDPAIAAALLTIHNNAHTSATVTGAAAPTRQRAPKIDRPKISRGSSEEVWNSFTTRWSLFKRGTYLSTGETVQHLFQCCDDELGDSILKGNPNVVNGTEDVLLAAIKQLAVVPVAISVRRADLLTSKQDHGENARAFVAKLKGKAATCSYTVVCSSNTCNQSTDFTDVIVKDVLVAGLADEDIKRDIMGWTELDVKDVNSTVAFIEAKEMARDAINQQPVNASLSSYKKSSKGETSPDLSQKLSCKECKVEISRYVWSKRRGKTIEVTHCMTCWRKSRPRRKPVKENNDVAKDETSSLIIGGVSITPHSESAVVHSTASGDHRKTREIILDHHIFHSQEGWKKSESMAHPTLRLRLTTDPEDYNHVGAVCPNSMPTFVTAVMDTGAQSCLWSLQDFYRCGFKDTDLMPVRRTMVAANREEIKIVGAIFIRLSGTDTGGTVRTAPMMAYVSPSTQKLYLPREAMIQLGVISKDFPKIGEVTEASSIEDHMAPCGCLKRSLPPARPQQLPFPASPENIDRMKVWLSDRFAASTFNKCTHQLLKGVTGPPLELHVDPDAKSQPAHSPAMIPLHWQENVKKQLEDDVALGVLEKVPYGEPSKWCHRMVVTRKADGGPRRTVDMSALNKASVRETHHVKPPFQQARSIPPQTWKTVTDAWNGYHSIPLCVEDVPLTTFITPHGRFRYKMAPQGSSASGDGYARRFDEVIADVERKTKCVDDTTLWDLDLEMHWWRVIDFHELCGQNGIILNFEKLQFCQREIDFAGFRITETGVKPLDKYLRAISEFPTPTKTTDIRSWFGLVHQVSHYSKLTEMLEPFKPFLSPKKKFEWSDELDHAFEASKGEIITAIKDGVQIYDPTKPTCLRPDWSQTGIGYFLSQKHCDCDSLIPDCCKNGWRITLAGSRFLKPAETRYAPVEGEALAIAWSLNHTKYFTQGCDNLVVVTDHKPLVQLFQDRTLDQITNSRLFSLKQATLPWKFQVIHRAGKENCFADATSRNPAYSDNDEEADEISHSEILAGIMLHEPDEASSDDSIDALCNGAKNIRAVTWDVVKFETSKDEVMLKLIALINATFPVDRSELPPELLPYWNIRNNLYVVDGVVLMNDQVLIPPHLRNTVAESYAHEPHARIIIPQNLHAEVIHTLHAAHQGVSGMNERAKAGVYWPGITKDIQAARENCTSCNNIMPSHARTPPVEPWIPTTPFEAVACDYFHYRGHYYFAAADRLSGWIEVQQVKVGTNDAGAEGLCKALRRMMVTFGVPVEISSDGGPEFIAGETKDFFKRWGIHHRLSSAGLPSSNGRAELGVKTAKRLLMENVGPSGTLDSDGVVRALLTYRNTPEPGCKLSPAQILLGRPLRDTLPYISKEVMVFNNSDILPQWREAWAAKEEALKTRYMKTLETLNEHSRSLPPLRHGDHVLMQNQHGRFPKKWGKSGMVVETKDYDQYVVKTAGTGRLTLRNRRFLRKFNPHHMSESAKQLDSPQITPQASIPCAPPPTVPSTPLAHEDQLHYETPSIVDHFPIPSPSPPSFALPVPSPSPPLFTPPPSANPRRVSFETLDSREQPQTDIAAPPVVERSPRPRRVRTQRQVYDAATGQSSGPCSVPEDV